MTLNPQSTFDFPLDKLEDRMIDHLLKLNAEGPWAGLARYAEVRKAVRDASRRRDEHGDIVHADRAQVDEMANLVINAEALLGHDEGRHYRLLNQVVENFCDLNYVYPTDESPHARQDVWALVYERILEIESRKK